MSDRRRRTIDQQVMEEQVEWKYLHGDANSQVGEEKPITGKILRHWQRQRVELKTNNSRESARGVVKG